MPTSFNSNTHLADAKTALNRFLIEHAEPLLDAAALLGERPAVRRTARLLEAVLDSHSPSRRVHREIIGLHRLLSLEDVDDLDSLEAACFSDVDPDSPAVADICLLADQLQSHLAAVSEAERSDHLLGDISNAA